MIMAVIKSFLRKWMDNPTKEVILGMEKEVDKWCLMSKCVCPECRGLVRRYMEHENNRRSPSKGDVVVCARCGHRGEILKVKDLESIDIQWEADYAG